jgi:tetratricopeptide (TPR) repeat protein
VSANSSHPDQYDVSLTNAASRTRVLEEKIASELEAAPALFDILDSSIEPKRALLLNRTAYRSMGFFLYVQKLASVLPPKDPETSLVYIDLALTTLSLIDHATYRLTPSMVADHRALLQALRGNAFRILSRYHPAEAAFLKAWKLFKESSGDPLTEATILTLHGGFLNHVGRLEMACDLLSRASSLALRIGDAQLFARTSAKHALTLGHIAPERAIPILTDLLDNPHATDLSLRFSIVHNLSWFLVDAGQPWQAHANLTMFFPLYNAIQNAIAIPYKYWLRGRIYRTAGDPETALGPLRMAHGALTEIGTSTDTLLSALDLAIVRTELGQHEAAQEHIRQGQAILDKHQEADTSGVLIWAQALQHLHNAKVLRALGLWIRMGQSRPFDSSLRILDQYK